MILTQDEPERKQGGASWGLIISMQGGEKLSLEQIRALLEASQEVRFAGHGRAEVYAWIGKTLAEHNYRQQTREAKGVLRTYVLKMTGLSRAQVARLIGQHARTGSVKEAVYRRRRFPTRYTRTDAALLAALDEAHDTLSGPATRKILEREFNEYDRTEYQRLVQISVAHLYRLRHSKSYRARRTHFTKTKPTPVSIGERRCPELEGRPGYLRVNTVHQGDRDEVKTTKVLAAEVHKRVLDHLSFSLPPNIGKWANSSRALTLGVRIWECARVFEMKAVSRRADA